MNAVAFVTWPVSQKHMKLTAAALLALVIPIYLINLGVDALLDYKVKASLKHEAEAKAKSWTNNLIERLPSIERIIETGKATAEERLRIDDAFAVARVFRFKLFTNDGHQTFVSDQTEPDPEQSSKINSNAYRTSTTQSPLIFIKDGHTNPQRPNHYVEAYIQAYSNSGKAIGIIEVYVDVAELHDALSTSFARLSWFLIFGSALIFLVPASLVAWRSWQLREKDRKLIEIEQVDYLTGTLNRKTISAHLSKLFSSNKTAANNGILFVDVDCFKQINDNHGHHAGDLILKHVARTIRDSIRSESDFVGRFGGDEFIVVCTGATESELLSIGERIIQAMRVPFRNGNTAISLSVSIGAYLSRVYDDQESALHAADLAVYEAKRRGRDQLVQHYEELDETFNRRNYVGSCLNRAISDDLLRLEFQPVFDIKNSNLLGFEALLRLIGQDGETIPPNEFIPIAEETGLIQSIGIWVLNRSVEVASSWPDHLFVSINLSVAQFKSDAFTLEVAKTLNRYEFDSHRLELEVTESLFIEDKQEVKTRFDLFKRVGVSMVLDDFGSGYSNLGYLWNFEFEKIKVDRSLLNRAESEDEKTRVILRAIAIIADQLGATVLVEGIETEEHLAIAKACHIEQAQGFLLGRPTPEVDLAEQYSLDEKPDLRLATTAA